MKLKRILVFVAAAVMFFAASAVIGSTKVEATGGHVMDGQQRPIVGMWIEVEGGGSGWASLGGRGYNRTWSYNTRGRRWQAHVGVGGTPQNWGANVKSGWIMTQRNNVQINTAIVWWQNQIHVS